MPLDLVDYERQAREAVRAFWGNREAARQKQVESGTVDQGARSAVTAGKNMDGFLDITRDIVRANGLAHAEVHLTKRVLTLPGYFRPTKLWDMLVTLDGRLVAAVEFKSQVGSFGNNYNNRTEEAIGTAVDLWTAFREGAFGADAPRPFVGWLMMIEDGPASCSPVRNEAPHFPAFPVFDGASYADRYNVLCRRLVAERLYSAASLLLSSRDGRESGDYRELGETTGLRHFVTELAAHVAAEAA